MIFYYLDASAWVKNYYREPGTGWVRDLFARDEDKALVCSSLGIVEVTATLARKRKSREISLVAFERGINELEDDWMRIIEVQFTTEVVEMARELAGKLALRGADAVHLASALLLQGRFEEESDRLILVTSDRELKQAAQESGLVVIDPDEQETEIP